jgi:short-subunit dehydrogenase
MSRRPSLNQNRVLITGGSSGIGEHLARQFASHQARVLVVARREDRLQALQREHSATEFQYLVGDVATAETRERIGEWIEREWGGLDLLVNNAGIGAVGPFLSSSESCMRELFEVNFFAPVELTRTLIPLMQQQTAPTIVNIGSVLGHFAATEKSEYCATKFAIHGFTDALYGELANVGIHVLLVSPSTTRSEFFSRERTKDAPSPFRFGAMTPAVVAAKTIRAIQAGKREIILSPGGKLSVWLDRIAPWWMARIQRGRGKT